DFPVLRLTILLNSRFHGGTDAERSHSATRTTAAPPVRAENSAIQAKGRLGNATPSRSPIAKNVTASRANLVANQGDNPENVAPLKSSRRSLLVSADVPLAVRLSTTSPRVAGTSQRSSRFITHIWPPSSVFRGVEAGHVVPSPLV